MSNTPLVSLGLPIYNGERFLQQLLDSLLGQTYENFELIVSDNASTDATLDICDGYARRDGRIVVHRAPTNQGTAWNHRRVCDLARGSYFKWVGADDLADSRFLEVTLAALLRRPDAVGAYPLTVVIDDLGNEIERTTERLPLDSPDVVTRFAALLPAIPRTQCAFYSLFRTALMSKARAMGSFLAADRCLLAELALYGEYVRVEEFLMFRRIHAAHRARTNAKEQKLYVPSDTRALQLRDFGALREHLASVRRAPVGPRTKIRLLRAVAEWSARERDNFYEEAKELIKHTLRTTRDTPPILAGANEERSRLPRQ